VEQFAEFVVTGMHRYRNQSIVWEILNEPGGATVVEWYPRLVQAIGEKIQQRNLTAEMLIGPAAGFNLISDGDIDPRAFNTSKLEQMFERGLLQHFKAVSIHPYGILPEDRLPNFTTLAKVIDAHTPVGVPRIPIISGEASNGRLSH
jgi:hypothetical protein